MPKTDRFTNSILEKTGTASKKIKKETRETLSQKSWRNSRQELFCQIALSIYNIVPEDKQNKATAYLYTALREHPDLEWQTQPKEYHKKATAFLRAEDWVSWRDKWFEPYILPVADEVLHCANMVELLAVDKSPKPSLLRKGKAVIPGETTDQPDEPAGRRGSKEWKPVKPAKAQGSPCSPTGQTNPSVKQTAQVKRSREGRNGERSPRSSITGVPKPGNHSATSTANGKRNASAAADHPVSIIVPLPVSSSSQSELGSCTTKGNSEPETAANARELSVMTTIPQPARDMGGPMTLSPPSTTSIVFHQEGQLRTCPLCGQPHLMSLPDPSSLASNNVAMAVQARRAGAPQQPAGLRRGVNWIWRSVFFAPTALAIFYFFVLLVLKSMFFTNSK